MAATTTAIAASRLLLLQQGQQGIPSTEQPDFQAQQQQQQQLEEWRARAGRAEERARELEGKLAAYQVEVRACVRSRCSDSFCSLVECCSLTCSVSSRPVRAPQVRELQAQAAAARSKPPSSDVTSSISRNVWRERMEMAQRELAAERSLQADRCVRVCVRASYGYECGGVSGMFIHPHRKCTSRPPHPRPQPPPRSEAAIRNLERELSAALQEREELRCLVREAEAGKQGEARHLRDQLAAEKRCVPACLPAYSVETRVMCVCTEWG